MTRKKAILIGGVLIFLVIGGLAVFSPFDRLQYSSKYKLGDNFCDALNAWCGYCEGDRKGDWCYIKKGQSVNVPGAVLVEL